MDKRTLDAERDWVTVLDAEDIINIESILQLVIKLLKTKVDDLKTEEEEEDKDTNDEMTVKKSFVTTVEDEDEEETIQVPQSTLDQTIVRTKTSPVPEPLSSEPVPPQPAAMPEPSLKRPLEPEKKQESQPPVAAAPPKRRRMVNAAPDV